MNTTETQFYSPLGTVKLQRLPLRKKETLRAWDAADEYLLNTLAELDTFPKKQERILLINDQFGALACCLADYDCTSWSDSFLAHLASQHNLRTNQLKDQLNCVASTETPEGYFSTVLIKIPKTLALLEQQLTQLRPLCTDNTLIIAGGMVKHIQRSVLELFEKIIGPTSTSLAKKKARVVFPEFDSTKTIKGCSYPCSFSEPSLNLVLSSHANVFAKEKLDIGARFILSQFEKLPQAKTIIDLGCGNGVLGIMAKRQYPDSHICFVDESYMAISSARENYQHYYQDEASYYHSDCLSQVPEISAGLILCNPPFHQQYAIGDHVAWRMFSQAKQHLGNGGELWVIGNRHLNYHVKLKRLFGNCRTVASDKKFVVMSCRV